MSEPEQRDAAERGLARGARRARAPRVRPGRAVGAGRGRRARVGGGRRSCSRAGVGVGSFSLGQPSLDEVFLALTGHPAEEDEQGRGGRPHEHATRDPAQPEPAIGEAAPQGPRRRGAPAAPERAVGVPDLRLARDAEDQARPGAADRRVDHAGAVPAHVHLPVRRRGRGLDAGVPAVPAPRRARAVRAVHLRLLRRVAQHGHHQGRGRPLPLAAAVAAGAARRRGASATASAT